MAGLLGHALLEAARLDTCPSAAGMRRVAALRTMDGAVDERVISR